MTKKKPRETQPIIYTFDTKFVGRSNVLDTEFQAVVILKRDLI